VHKSSKILFKDNRIVKYAKEMKALKEREGERRKIGQSYLFNCKGLSIPFIGVYQV